MFLLDYLLECIMLESAPLPVGETTVSGIRDSL